MNDVTSPLNPLSRRGNYLSEEVATLLRSEDINLTTPECKLATGNFLIDFQRNIIDHRTRFTAYFFSVFHQISGTESLDCKRHIHDFSRMSVTCCEIHETSFRYYIYPVAILQLVAYNILPGRLDLYGHFSKASHIYLTVEMASITADRTILHPEEMLLYDHGITAGNRYEDEIGRAHV